MTSPRQTRTADEMDDYNVPKGVEVGTVLAGKYRVESVLGEGGMGVVVHATHIMLKTPVAMKFLLPEFTRDEHIVARFLREAQAAVSLKNRYVASVIDVGTLESGSPYIVMEYLDGYDLDHLIDEEGPLTDYDRVATLLLQACEGLACAHAAGVVHRDVKPGNLFLAQDLAGQDQIKILDFGISKVEEQLSGLTRTGTVMGSPMYMSPEQMRNTRNVDHRADIWSLGVVAFQMLTQYVPYDAETMTGLIARVLEEDPPRVREYAPDVPPVLDEIVARALVKDVNERYQSMAEFALDLAAFLGDDVALDGAKRVERIVGGISTGHSLVTELPISPKSRSHITQRRSLSDPSVPPVGTVADPQPAGGNNKLMLGGIALLVVAGIIAAVALSGGDDTPPSVATPAAEDPLDQPTVPVAAPPEPEAPAAAAAAPEVAAPDETPETELAPATEAPAEAVEQSADASDRRRSSRRRRRSRDSAEAAAPMPAAMPASMSHHDDVFGSRN